MSKTFAGFGFGPIQSGLFLYEAIRSGNFSRYVISEVDEKTVRAVADSGNSCVVNIARPGGIDHVRIENIELYNPNDPSQREAFLNAAARSDEMATSLPSIRFFDLAGPACVANLIASAIDRRETSFPTIVYTAENHNHAAEYLHQAVLKYLQPQKLANVQFLNTVVGKMSGVITDEDAIRKLKLQPMASGLTKAVLVEEFNRILISPISLANFKRGIEVFVEKPDLLPFEEAKLYGHNAIHALIGFLADYKNLATIAQAGLDESIMKIARNAFIKESGLALCRRRAAVDDELFTERGFAEYADDLLRRMTSPYLHDLVVRVVRDPLRKLAFDDRMFGLMHICLEQKIVPDNLAIGAAAGITSLVRRQNELTHKPVCMPKSVEQLTKESLAALLSELWAGKADKYSQQMIDLTWNGVQKLHSIG